MQYVVEPGTFEIMVGTNSEELQKKEAVWDDGKVSEASSVKGRVVVQHKKVEWGEADKSLTPSPLPEEGGE